MVTLAEASLLSCSAAPVNAIVNKRSAPHYGLEKDSTFYTSAYLAIQLGLVDG